VEIIQTNAVKIEAMDEEDRDWLESDLSHLSNVEPYDWADIDPEATGQLIHFEQGVGFVIEGGEDSGQDRLSKMINFSNLE
jgi:hypothetical protein